MCLLSCPEHQLSQYNCRSEGINKSGKHFVKAVCPTTKIMFPHLGNPILTPTVTIYTNTWEFTCEKGNWIQCTSTTRVFIFVFVYKSVCICVFVHYTMKAVAVSGHQEIVWRKGSRLIGLRYCFWRSSARLCLKAFLCPLHSGLSIHTHTNTDRKKLHSHTVLVISSLS